MLEHVYICEAAKMVGRLLTAFGRADNKNFVELGCGTGLVSAHVLPLLPKGARLTLLDHDRSFLDYLRGHLRIPGDGSVNIVQADVTRSIPLDFVADFIFSQGMHHHIPKGEPLHRYLQNVRAALRRNGVYVLVDEILAPHDLADEYARQVMSTAWHLFVIVLALIQDHHDLAMEEGKTLCDDVMAMLQGYKTKEQVAAVLNAAERFRTVPRDGLPAATLQFAPTLLTTILGLVGHAPSDDATLVHSRGDIKVCGPQIIRELTDAGFTLTDAQTLGPVDTIGGFGIYTFQNAA